MDGDMVMAFRVDSTGSLIPLCCHPALTGVSSFLTTSIVSKSVKEVFNRSLGPISAKKSTIKDVVWESFSEIMRWYLLHVSCLSDIIIALRAVRMCNCKSRRVKGKPMAMYEFPVPFPDEGLWEKGRRKWTNKDLVDVALWLDACGTELGAKCIPDPVVAWAKAQAAAVAGAGGAVVLAVGPQAGAPVAVAQA